MAEDHQISEPPVYELHPELHHYTDWHGLAGIAVKPTDMWYPTHEELLSASVVTAVVDSKRFGLSGIKEWGDALKIDEGLLQVPSFLALSKYDPASYKKFNQITVDGIRQGRSMIEIQTDIRTVLIDQLLPRYLRTAPDKELIEYWAAQVNEAKYLAKLGPDKCAGFLMGDSRLDPLELQNLLPKELQDEDSRTLGALIEGASITPQKAPAMGTLQLEIEAILISVFARDKRYGETIMNINKASSDSELVCSSLIAFYDEILAVDDSTKKGDILRAMLSQ